MLKALSESEVGEGEREIVYGVVKALAEREAGEISLEAGSTRDRASRVMLEHPPALVEAVGGSGSWGGGLEKSVRAADLPRSTLHFYSHGE